MILMLVARSEWRGENHRYLKIKLYKTDSCQIIHYKNVITTNRSVRAIPNPSCQHSRRKNYQEDTRFNAMDQIQNQKKKLFVLRHRNRFPKNSLEYIFKRQKL